MSIVGVQAGVASRAEAQRCNGAAHCGSAMETLADGSTVKVDTEKETIAIRCIEPGHYDLASNLYAYKIDGVNQDNARNLGLKVHVEIVGLNPSYRLVFAKDVVLDYVGQTINWASFDMDRTGAVTLVDPPLEPITATYQRRLIQP